MVDVTRCEGLVVFTAAHAAAMPGMGVALPPRRMATEDLLTVNDDAKLLGISPWTMRHWISDGKIEFVKYGNGLVRLKRSTLDDFVASSTIRAKRPACRRVPHRPR
jgi:excisionase family DNA binding protein